MAEDRKTPRCPLWVKIVLALSLAVNLAIAGLVAGAVLRGGPMGGNGPAMGYAMPYVIALPREDRRGVFDTVRRDESLPNRRARRADYEAMITALRADPFDAAAIQDILRRQADGVSRVQAVAQAAWLETVAAMSPEERADYTLRIQEVLKRGGKGKDKGKGKDGGAPKP